MTGGEAAFYGLMSALGFVLLVVFVVFYVLKSLGISALAANRGFENPWLGWVPVADLYLLGMLVGSMDLFGFKLDKLEFIIPAVMVGASVLSPIPLLGQLIMLAAMVVFVMFTYKLFEMYSKNNAVLYTLLSMLLGLLPIFLFLIRNNIPQSQASPDNTQY